MPAELMSAASVPLPPIAQAYLDSLPAGRVALFPLAALDRTGVCCWKAALFLDDQSPLGDITPDGYGYGLTDAEAIIGAFGELLETTTPSLAHLNRVAAGARYEEGSYHDLLPRAGRRGIVDPLTLCLPAGSPVGQDTPLAWERMTRRATGEQVLVPIDIAIADDAALPRGYKPFTTLISNGLGAGPTLDWATAHGLLEILQRDGNGLLFRALDPGVGLDLGPANRDAAPDARALLDRFASAGIISIPKFATDEFGLANLFVVGREADGHQPAHPIMASAAGEACDPDRDRALRKALLEFAAARVRKAFSHGPLEVARRIAPPGYMEPFLARALAGLDAGDPRAFSEMKRWVSLSASELEALLAPTVYAIKDHKAFSGLPVFADASAEARQQHVFRVVEEAGFDILVLDGSLPDRPMKAVKVVVPGLEVETMSYDRIGERNTRKLMEADSPLIRFDEPSSTLKPVRLTEEALVRLGGRTPLFDTTLARKIVGGLYPLYREPESHVVGAPEAAGLV